MQIAEVRKMITDIYNVLTYAKEYADIQQYLLNTEYIHDGFWPLHKELTEAKVELRTAVNNVTESSEKVDAIVQSISNLIERDRQNRRKNMTAKIEVVVVEGKL